MAERAKTPLKGRAKQAPPPAATGLPRGADWELIARRMCLAKDTGHAGTLWGGNMMAWVDEVGAIFAAMRTTNRWIVTKHFSEVDFHGPVRPADIVEFRGRVVRVGTTSLTVEIDVVAWSPTAPEPRRVLRVEGVFVAVDEEFRKEPVRLRP